MMQQMVGDFFLFPEETRLYIKILLSVSTPELFNP